MGFVSPFLNKSESLPARAQSVLFLLRSDLPQNCPLSVEHVCRESGGRSAKGVWNQVPPSITRRAAQELSVPGSSGLSPSPGSGGRVAQSQGHRASAPRPFAL